MTTPDGMISNKVRFLLVGAYAVAVYGFPRATKHIDFFVSLVDLITNKRASGRTQDLADIEKLESTSGQQ
jgi:hypothetical protein